MDVLASAEEIAASLEKDVAGLQLKGRTLTVKLKATDFRVRSPKGVHVLTVMASCSASHHSTSAALHQCTTAPLHDPCACCWTSIHSRSCPSKDGLWHELLPFCGRSLLCYQTITRAISVEEPISKKEELLPLAVRLVKAEMPLSLRLIGQFRSLCRHTHAGQDRSG